MTWHRSRPPRTVAATAVCALLLAAVGGCTGTSEPSAKRTPGASTETPATLEPKPVPLDLKVGRVAGSRMGAPQLRGLERQISQVVEKYVDAAYLGEYPRQNFTAAFAGFAPGAARTARGDRGLLSNHTTGAVTEAVAARTKWVRLDVLAPRQRALGVTARLRLVFDQERTDVPPQRVTVSGRLILGRTKGGGWEIFGYSLSRSSVPIAKGAR